MQLLNLPTFDTSCSQPIRERVVTMILDSNNARGFILNPGPKLMFEESPSVGARLLFGNHPIWSAFGSSKTTSGWKKLETVLETAIQITIYSTPIELLYHAN